MPARKINIDQLPDSIIQNSYNGDNGLRTFNKGAVLIHVGDSRTCEGFAWGGAYKGALTNRGGVFDGWNNYNMGANGTAAGNWASSIASGNVNEAVSNNLVGYGGYNLWAVKNGNPDVIIFSLGTNDLRMDGSSSGVTALVTAITSCINFLLINTNAIIIMRMPPPIAFANPDPSLFTNCTSTTDAANRSISIRTIYNSYFAKSDRIIVLDTHKNIYGTQIDSVSACIDSATGLALMTDTLHPTQMGATREAQMLAKAVNNNIRYKVDAKQATLAIAESALWSCTVNISGGGSGYFDMTKNPVSYLFGDVSDITWRNAGTWNIPFAEALLYADVVSKTKQLLLIGKNFSIYHHDSGTTAINTNTPQWIDKPTNKEWRAVNLNINLTGKTGLSTIFVTDAGSLPASMTSLSTPITIAMQGATTTGIAGVSIPFQSGIYNFSIPRAVRDTNGGTCTIEVYISNQVTGSFNATPYPGMRIGTIGFSNGFRISDSFAIDATNFPNGLNGINYNPDQALFAKVITGAVGNFASITFQI